MFSYAELRSRIEPYYSQTILNTNTVGVLNDLYRLGFLGNYLPAAKSYHWQHKGDSQLILADEWRIFIHYALHGALSIRTRNDREINRKIGIQPGDLVRVKVRAVIKSFALVTFSKYGQKYEGQIHISEFGRIKQTYISDLSSVVSVGNDFDAIVKQYCKKYRCWELAINGNEMNCYDGN